MIKFWGKGRRPLHCIWNFGLFARGWWRRIGKMAHGNETAFATNYSTKKRGRSGRKKKIYDTKEIISKESWLFPLNPCWKLVNSSFSTFLHLVLLILLYWIVWYCTVQYKQPWKDTIYNKYQQRTTYFFAASIYGIL